MKITIEIVEEFLKTLKKDRTWLAAELGCSRGTVNNWFSKGVFPLWAENSIRRIINEFEQKQKPGSEDLQFTFREWQSIQQAMERAGVRDIDSFIRAVLIEKAREIVESDG
ncbi:MAG: hypothetical protein P1V20_16765 [Verrucomicrobiales bacterium]|nr:hypothetical protein [Verrucomicrobiales bacterium]